MMFMLRRFGRLALLGILRVPAPAPQGASVSGPSPRSGPLTRVRAQNYAAKLDSAFDDGVGDLPQALLAHLGTVSHQYKRLSEGAVGLHRNHARRLVYAIPTSLLIHRHGPPVGQGSQGGTSADARHRPNLFPPLALPPLNIPARPDPGPMHSAWTFTNLRATPDAGRSDQLEGFGTLSAGSDCSPRWRRWCERPTERRVTPRATQATPVTSRPCPAGRMPSLVARAHVGS